MRTEPGAAWHFAEHYGSLLYIHTTRKVSNTPASVASGEISVVVRPYSRTAKGCRATAYICEHVVLQLFRLLNWRKFYYVQILVRW